MVAFQNTRVHPKSKQPSFEVCSAWLFLRNEVDFVNVRFDSGNLDCQPLNPWTSMAARDASGHTFYSQPQLTHLLKHTQNFLPEIFGFLLDFFLQPQYSHLLNHTFLQKNHAPTNSEAIPSENLLLHHANLK